MLRLMTGVAATKAMARLMDSAVDRAYAQRHPTRSKTTMTKGALPAAAVGAGLMYFLDPASGSERRSRVASMVTSMLRQSGDKMSGTAHTVQTKSRDAMNKSISMVKHSTDEQLVSRVRSVISEVSEKGSAIHVEVNEGRLIVSGPVDEAHIQRLRNALQRIPGLSSIDDRLEIRETQPTQK